MSAHRAYETACIDCGLGITSGRTLWGMRCPECRSRIRIDNALDRYAAQDLEWERERVPVKPTSEFAPWPRDPELIFAEVLEARR